VVKRSSHDSSKGAPAATAGGQPALVVAAYGRRGLLETADGTRLPCLVASRRLRFVCGDRVTWQPGAEGIALIQDIAPRSGLLERQTERAGAPEPVAANLTHVLVLLAPRPAPDLELADRYLAAATLMGAAGAVAWNKAELEEPPTALDAYARAGHPVFKLSARAGTGIDTLLAWIGTGTAVVVGQSGVGKSSLLNRLAPEAAGTTGELSASTGEGRHTTTATVMFRVGAGWLADTPGVRDFVPAVPEPHHVRDGFLELRALAPSCRFADCSHRHEPGCRVLASVATGEVDRRRYESYVALRRTAEAMAERRRPR
jgi:ribosome biogenesis GTPase